MSEPSSHNSDVDPTNILTDQERQDAVVCYGIGRVTTEKLFGGLRELEIVHGSSLYRLRITSTGKLILTK